jgi:HSP20 family protein
MLNVDQVIREVSGVYQSLTGRPIQAGRAEMPPEVDPMGHIEGRYRQFKTLMDTQAVPGLGAMPSARAGAMAQVMGAQPWTPSIDVVEHEREVVVDLELAGVPREQITVSLAGDYLVVRGERPAMRVPQGGTVRHQGRRTGPFQALVALPPRARREGVEASLHDGVLRVTVPTDGSGNDVSEVPVDVK